MKTFTITLNEQQVEVLEHLMETRGNRTEQQVMEQAVERGLYQLDYRTERNKKVYEKQRKEREELKELRQLLRTAK